MLSSNAISVINKAMTEEACFQAIDANPETALNSLGTFTELEKADISQVLQLFGEQKRKDIKEKKKEIEDDGRKNSEIISERARFISLAIMGLSWTFIVANLTLNAQSGAGLIGTKDLLTPIFLSAVALLLDFSQYILNQFSIDISLFDAKIFAKILKSFAEILKFFARIAFYAKIICAFLTVMQFAQIIWIVIM